MHAISSQGKPTKTATQHARKPSAPASMTTSKRHEAPPLPSPTSTPRLSVQARGSIPAASMRRDSVHEGGGRVSTRVFAHALEKRGVSSDSRHVARSTSSPPRNKVGISRTGSLREGKESKRSLEIDRSSVTLSAVVSPRRLRSGTMGAGMMENGKPPVSPSKSTSHSKHMSMTSSSSSRMAQDTSVSPRVHQRRMSIGTSLVHSVKPRLSITTAGIIPMKDGSTKTAPAIARPTKIPSPLPPIPGTPRSVKVKETMDVPPVVPRRRSSVAATDKVKLKEVAPAIPVAKGSATAVLEFAEASKRRDEQRRAQLGLGTSEAKEEIRARTRSFSTSVRTKSLQGPAPSWISSGGKEDWSLKTVSSSTSSPPPPLSSKSSARSSLQAPVSSKRSSLGPGTLHKAVSFHENTTPPGSSGKGSATTKRTVPSFTSTVYPDRTDTASVKSGSTATTSRVGLKSERTPVDGSRLAIGNGTVEPAKSVISEPPPGMRRSNRGSIADGASFTSEPDRPRVRQALSPQDVLDRFGDQLSPYERGEILEYPQIYYFGKLSRKQSGKILTVHNFGYDDERGDYIVHQRDHLQYRYEIAEVLGQGSFGQVVRCRDHKKGEWVAIKIIRNKKRFHTQALVECKILENLRKWDPNNEHGVVRMMDHFYFRNHLCISFECLSLNLYDFIKQNQFRGFSLGLIRRFSSQVLKCLELLRVHDIIHCDLKPENILLVHPTKSAVKVIDFGSSCHVNERVYTYIQSRFYRSPEVILGMPYGRAIDVWSLGCIAAELYTGYPLFPGEDEHDQLQLMMEVLGMPDTALIESCSRRDVFFDASGNARAPPNPKHKRRRPGSKSLKQALKATDERFLDFVAKCLIWDPEKRISPDEALRHEWIADGPVPLTPIATTSFKDAVMSAAKNISASKSIEDLSFSSSSIGNSFQSMSIMDSVNENSSLGDTSFSSTVRPLRVLGTHGRLGYHGMNSSTSVNRIL